MAKKGLLVDYKWCTGCHSCEIACQMEHDLPVGQYGIKICEVGPWKYGKDGEHGEEKWQYSYFPLLTDQCNLCAKRLAKGKLPTCVKHCQSKCLKFGTPSEVAEALESKRKQLFITL